MLIHSRWRPIDLRLIEYQVCVIQNPRSCKSEVAHIIHISICFDFWAASPFSQRCHEDKRFSLTKFCHSYWTTQHYLLAFRHLPFSQVSAFSDFCINIQIKFPPKKKNSKSPGQWSHSHTTSDLNNCPSNLARVPRVRNSMGISFGNTGTHI